MKFTKTKTNLNHDFCTEMFPAYLFEKYIGLATFNIKGLPGKRTLKNLNRITLYRIISFAIFIAVTVIAVYFEDDVIPAQPTKLLYWYVHIYDTYADVLLLWAAVIPALLHSHVARSVWKGIMITDYKLEELGFRSSSYLHYCSIFWVILKILLNVIAHISNENNSPRAIFLNIIFCFMTFYQISTEISFQSWMLSLNMRFRFLNEDVLQQKERIPVNQMQNILRLHEDLRSLARNANRLYSLPISMDLALSWFVVIWQFYGLKSGPNGNIYILSFFVYMAVWLSFSCVNAALIVYSAQVVTKHVSKFLTNLT